MATTSKSTQSKLEAARAEFAAKKNIVQEHEPEVVHAAAIQDAVEAAPTWARRAIGFVAGIFASAATYYYGVMAANMLLLAIGGGFWGFFMYLLCLAVLWMSTIAAGWVVNGAVVSGETVGKVSAYVTGWFSKAKSEAAAKAAAVTA